MLSGQTEPPRGPSQQAVAAFLFTYDLRPGMQQEFEAGYREHLEWHRQVGDPFAWYGWYVLIGDEGLGRFVDGTFGHHFEDFDRRVDPASDRVHSAEHVDPFVEPVSRVVWRLRPDLGTAAPLESRVRSPLLEVLVYSVRAGQEEIFERAVSAGRSEDRKVQAWYQLVVGGRTPTYLSITPRAAWKDFDDGFASPLGESDCSVEGVQSQVWAFREDLSYFPESR